VRKKKKASFEVPYSILVGGGSLSTGKKQLVAGERYCLHF
jgi:hypothetical protein